MNRPGWIARYRARGGIKHRRGEVSLGYRSAFSTAYLTQKELGLGGLMLGAPGSGKTYAAALLVESLAYEGIGCVILDPKPSRDLAAVVSGVDGTIWSLGGSRQWDALPANPSELANQLVEVLPVDARTKVYRDAARLWVLVAGQALQRRRERPTVQRMAALCRREGLKALLESQSTHIVDLPKLSSTEMDGVLSMGTSLSILARGAAGTSLGSGAGALRLEEAISANKIVLLQLAAGPYPEETRMLGAWALRSMLRLLRHPVPCVLICDEFARLGVQGRSALELLALGREFGKPVVLCTQGPSDFEELGAHALDQAVQDASWLLAFRQGTRDSTTASRLLGVRWGEERTWSKGRETRENVRMTEQPYVSAAALEDLEPGTAYLRVPRVDRRKTRVEHVRMAYPALVGRGKAVPLTQWEEESEPALPLPVAETIESTDEGEEAPEVDQDLTRVLRRLEQEGEIDGECRLWPATGCNGQGYAKVSVADRIVTVHKWLWERENGPMPPGWTVEHKCHTEAKRRGECAGGKACKHRRCCEMQHLEGMPHGENIANRDEPTP